MSYRLRLEIFEGPLDLLLYLIKKNDVDIRDIPIAKITEQYMQYIEMMQMLDLELVGDFLVMAATLLQIKSRMLLPPDPSEILEAGDPREDLIRRLSEYKRFKEIADELQIKEAVRKDFFPRGLDETAINQIKDEAKEIYYEANLFDLITALSEALKKLPEEVIHEIIKEEYTIDQKIHHILHLMLNTPRVLLTDLFQKAKTKVEAIVTFLAVLELIRLKEIKVVQKNLFGEIEVLRNKENIEPVPSEGEGAAGSPVDSVTPDISGNPENK